MNRVRPVAAAALAVAAAILLSACGSNPYAGPVVAQPAQAGAQEQPPGGAVQVGGATQVRLIASTVDGLGDVISDGDGHTLYRFDKDTSQPPNSNCDGDCAKTWPPLLADTTAQASGLDQNLVSLVTRSDGTKQVTVGGWPLYRYAKDTGSGVALGQGVTKDWAAVTPEGGKASGTPDQAPADGSAPASDQAAAPAKPVDVGINEIDGLGPILTDTNGKTLYLFTKDKGSGTSTCDGACATTWPPLLVDDRITVAEEVNTALIGQARRSDGKMQVTIGGWPVYTYSKDSAPGQANGHTVGGTWFAVEPNGCKVDENKKPTAGGTQNAAASPGGY